MTDNLEKYEENAPKGPIHIRKVSFREYHDQKDLNLKRNNRLSVEMDEWHEVPDTTVILNGGANPCLLLYAFSAATKTILTGHFSVFNQKELSGEVRVDEGTLTESGLIMPSQRDTEVFTQFGADRELSWLQNYEAMVRRINELVKQNGSNSIEIYMFGQNIGGSEYEGKSDAIIASWLKEDLIRRFYIDSDIKRTGVSVDNIHDMRNNTFNSEDLGDSTIYLPESHTIIHGERI